MKILVVVTLLLTAASCAASNDSSLCTCDYATEKYDGGQCVPAADFSAPECTVEEASVCGCDDLNYTSTCAAYTAGVEVKYGGACRANSGGGGGGGFGW